MDVATELRAEAARQRMHGRTLAKTAGVSHTTVLRKLAGNRRLTVDDLEAFSKALNVPAWELLRRAEEAAEKKAS